MPNAKDIQKQEGYKILMIGNAGSGKTTNFATLPGRKFLYAFDPNVLRSIRGFDIDYELFEPDVTTFEVNSLTKGVGDKPKVPRSPLESYNKWEEHFEKALADNFFETYDWIGFDSLTTFQDLIMDRVLELNNRAGKWPHEDDYGPVMNSFKNIMRSATSITNKAGKPISIYCTGHYDTIKDEKKGTTIQIPILYGKLRAKIPLLFTDFLSAESDGSASGMAEYYVRTQPSNTYPSVRSSLRGAPPKLNVTLDWKKPLEGQGLGKYYK